MRRSTGQNSASWNPPMLERHQLGLELGLPRTACLARVLTEHLAAGGSASKPCSGPWYYNSTQPDGNDVERMFNVNIMNEMVWLAGSELGPDAIYGTCGLIGSPATTAGDPSCCGNMTTAEVGLILKSATRK